MRSVQKVWVRNGEKEVEMEVFDTFSEEALSHRFVGRFELDGKVCEVSGPYSTACQVEASQVVGGHVPEMYPARKFPHMLPPYHVPEVEELIELCGLFARAKDRERERLLRALL